jgi:hypothetical protein
MIVPKDSDDAAMEKWRQQLQDALERCRIFSEENVGKVGTREFPII